MSITPQPALSGHLSGNSIIDLLTHYIGLGCRWMVFTMVLLQFALVLLRYLFDTGSIAAQDMVLYLFGGSFMLAFAEALARDRHVRVDLLYAGFTARTRCWVDLIGSILLLFPLMLTLTWWSLDYVSRSWSILEASSEVGGMPGVFLMKTIIQVSMSLLLLQSLVIMWRCYTRITASRREDGTHA